MSQATELETRRATQKVTGIDWILPAIAVAFATYYLISINSLRWEAKVSGLLVALIVAVLVTAFAIKTVIGLTKGKLRVEFSGLSESRDGAIRQLILVGLIVGFIALIQTIGFTLSVFIFLSANLIFVASLPVVRALALSAVISLCGYLLFIVALQTDFPVGPFEQLLAPLVRMFS
jgi:hypothetical protein